jgi:hypothetical protein
VAVRVADRCEFIAVFGDSLRERPPITIRVTREEEILFEQTIEMGRN